MGQSLMGCDSAQLFDVIAYDATGNAKFVVSAQALLSGAIACARGFNSQPGPMVAVVLPAQVEEPKHEPEVDPDGLVDAGDYVEPDFSDWGFDDESEVPA